MTNDHLDTAGSPRRTRLGLKIAILGAGIAAGAIGATALGASAQTSSPSTTSSTAAAQSAPTGSNNPPPGGHGGATPIRGDEKALSASVTASLKAAALKAVPGGTVYRVESDAGDGAYEAHMTEADGTLVTVKFDKNLAVTDVEADMGTGDPAPAGQPPAGH